MSKKKVRARSPRTEKRLSDYRRTRKSYLQKIRRYEKKHPEISIPRPEIPKKITEGSIRKLERMSEKLSKVMKQGKLEKVYGEKKYEVPDETGTTEDEAPDFEEIVIDDYMNFIMRAYDVTAVETMLGLNGNKHSRSVEIIEAHADHCLDMLRDIGAQDPTRRKQIVNNLVHERVEVYNKTDSYIFGYESIRMGELGDVTLLKAVEEILTRAVTGSGLSETARQEYSELLKDNVEWGDIYE